MQQTSITFIGGGNMARSLIGGLIATGYPAKHLCASDPSDEKLSALAQEFGIRTDSDNCTAVENTEVVVLAVKPQVMQQAVTTLGAALMGTNQLIISIAAGIRLQEITAWLGHDAAAVRTMPNTPALVGSGVTALYANPLVSTAQRDLAESIMRAVGATLWLDEEAQLDAVTAVSGSGPAYFFLFIEALEEAALANGLPAEAARLLAVETAFGAAKMALATRTDPAKLRVQVTSPGGTTERALAEFEQGDLRGLVLRAVDAATRRSRELAEQFGASHGE
jgi:pyrroline-5-carboxylate reductase